MKLRRTASDRTAAPRASWREQARSAVRTRGELEAAYLASFASGPDAGEGVPGLLDDAAAPRNAYAMKITPYYFGLIERFDASDPIFLQAVPTRRELDPDPAALDDPIGDRCSRFRIAEAVIHRYPDRALFLPTRSCHVNCRFCFRRGRESGERGGVTPAALIEEGIAALAARPSIREIVVTGGDPLTLDDDVLLPLLERLAGLPHVRTLRIHTRIPAVNPARITTELCRGLARLDVPLWLATQFNHARELTTEACGSLGELRAAGIPLLNQSVLLRGVNDSGPALEELLLGLVEARVKPYYIHHPDRASGTAHFRVSLRRGLRLVKKLRGRIPGYAIPHYVLDIPGGAGKIPLEHAWIEERSGGIYHVTAPDGSSHDYRDGAGHDDRDASARDREDDRRD